MLAIERILEIEAAFGEKIQGLVPLELDGESLRLILYLKVAQTCGSPNNGVKKRSGATITIGLLLPTNSR